MAAKVDYCDSKALYCDSNEHIGCQFKGKAHKFMEEPCEWWTDVELFNFEQENRDKMVEEHNKKRSDAGQGGAVEGATATKMCTLVRKKINFRIKN